MCNIRLNLFNTVYFGCYYKYNGFEDNSRVFFGVKFFLQATSSSEYLKPITIFCFLVVLINLDPTTPVVWD